jgi:SAM-dependent methyltransferase
MSSAWLAIPLDVYEAHVELPQVGQAPAIRAAIHDAVAAHQPQSFLCLGCAGGGNGLSEIPASTRLLGIDLSPDSLRCLESRHAGRPATWLPHDLNHPLAPLETFDLAFGALILEYLRDPSALLANLPARRGPALGAQCPIHHSPARRQAFYESHAARSLHWVAVNSNDPSVWRFTGLLVALLGVLILAGVLWKTLN